MAHRDASQDELTLVQTRVRLSTYRALKSEQRAQGDVSFAQTLRRLLDRFAKEITDG